MSTEYNLTSIDVDRKTIALLAAVISFHLLLATIVLMILSIQGVI